MFPAFPGCWQTSVPYSHGTETPISFLTADCSQPVEAITSLSSFPTSSKPAIVGHVTFMSNPSSALNYLFDHNQQSLLALNYSPD